MEDSCRVIVYILYLKKRDNLNLTLGQLVEEKRKS